MVVLHKQSDYRTRQAMQELVKRRELIVRVGKIKRNWSALYELKAETKVQDTRYEVV